MPSNSMVLTSAAVMSNPLPGTPVLLMRGDRRILTTDLFTGPADAPVAGRLTDAAAGGSPLPWNINTATPMFRLDGAGNLVSTGANGSYLLYVEQPAADHREIEIGVRIVDKFASSFFIDLFRTHIDIDRKIRVILKTDGAGEFTYTAPSGQGSAVIPGGMFTYAAGDRIRASYNTKTGAARLWVNDVLKVNNPAYFPPAPVDAAIRFGLAGTTSATGKVRDFSLTETIL